MARLMDQLRAAGIRLVPDAEAVRTECTRIAGLLQDHGMSIVGMIPSCDDVGVPPIALQLARGLLDATGTPVGIVDAAGTWPVDPKADLDDRLPPSSHFVSTWLVGDIALITPDPRGIGDSLLRLERGLREEAATFGSLVVDLTGFDRLGTHTAAIALMDGVIIVARAGVTLDAQLARWMRETPEEKCLGVLLVSVR